MDFNIKGLKDGITLSYTLREKESFEIAYKQAKKTLDEIFEISLCTNFLDK